MHNTNTPTHTQRFPLHLLKLVLLGFILQMLGRGGNKVGTHLNELLHLSLGTYNGQQY